MSGVTINKDDVVTWLRNEEAALTGIWTSMVGLLFGYFSLCLSVFLSVCLSTCLSVCLLVSVSVYLSVCLFACLCLFA